MSKLGCGGVERAGIKAPRGVYVDLYDATKFKFQLLLQVGSMTF